MTSQALLGIMARIEELKQLKAGWLDGEGLPPDHGGLEWLRGAFDAHFPDDLPNPYLFPTPEGHVIAEWPAKPWSPSLEIDLKAKTAEWHALNQGTDEEKTKSLDLANVENWNWLANEMRLIGECAP